MPIADLVLGTMYFGTRTDEATSFLLLDRFVEAGGTTIDTANCYSFWASGDGTSGQSEAVIGRWLRANPGVRDQLTIATKVGVTPEPDDFSTVEGLSAEAIRRGFEGSQERLGIEVVDLYWAHGEDRSVDLTETVEAFGELVQRGVVARLGASNHPTWRVERARALARAAGVAEYSALQLTTSYVRPRPDVTVPGKDHRFGFFNDEGIDYVTEHPEIEVWAYSPLIQGSYDRSDRPFPAEYDHPGTTARLAALGAVADRLGTTRGQVVTAWLLAGGDGGVPIKPILGVSSAEQLDEGLAAGEVSLSEADLRELADAR